MAVRDPSKISLGFGDSLKTQASTFHFGRMWSLSEKFDTKPLGDQLAASLLLLGQLRLTDTDPAGVKLGVFNQWLTSGPADLRGELLTENDLREGPDWLRSGASALICKERYRLAPERIWIAELASLQKYGIYFPQQCLLPGYNSAMGFLQTWRDNKETALELVVSGSLQDFCVSRRSGNDHAVIAVQRAMK